MKSGLERLNQQEAEPKVLFLLASDRTWAVWAQVLEMELLHAILLHCNLDPDRVCASSYVLLSYLARHCHFGSQGDVPSSDLPEAQFAALLEAACDAVDDGLIPLADGNRRARRANIDDKDGDDGQARLAHLRMCAQLIVRPSDVRAWLEREGHAVVRGFPRLPRDLSSSPDEMTAKTQIFLAVMARYCCPVAEGGRYDPTDEHSFPEDEELQEFVRSLGGHKTVAIEIGKILRPPRSPGRPRVRKGSG